MAWYKYAAYVQQFNSDAFDKLYTPGSVPDHSGIFRCTGCGREVVGEHTRSLPPQNHHQHTVAQGDIRWKLTVWPNHNPQ